MLSTVIALLGTKDNPIIEIPTVKKRDPNKWYLYNGVPTQYKYDNWITPKYIERKRKRQKKYKKKKAEEKKKKENTQEYKNKVLKKKVFSRLREIRRLNKYFRTPEWKKHKSEYDKKRRAKKEIKDKRKKSDAEYYKKFYKEKLLCIHCEEVLATKKHFRKHCMNCFSLLFPDEFKEITKNYNYNQTEMKVFDWLKDLFPFIDNNYKNWRPEWFERNFEFDIVFHELKLIIEIDGEQHYSFDPCVIRHFNKNITTEERIERDVYKMKKANERGYSVIRIIQKDIWEDKNNWENNLFAAIKSYDTPTNIFICSNDEYDNHKKLLNN